MRILIAPMSALAETSGPMSRVRSLALAARERGYEVAFCAAQDPNFRPVEGVRNYYAPVPSPFGAPLSVGKAVLSLVQALGLQQRVRVTSFEQVLHIVGATNKRFFAQDVNALRRTIGEFHPDVVYAEFRIAAIVAARLEEANAVTSFSYPVQTSYACNPEFSKGVNAFLLEQGLPQVYSVLDIFDWARIKFVPSSHELEPVEDPKAVFVGPYTTMGVPRRDPEPSHNIVAYMGSGTISPKRLVRVLTAALSDARYQVYISTRGVTPFQRGNIKVAAWLNFDELLPGAVAFINHGGQNSVMTGLVHGVPQIICPGKVFERQYNAASIERLGAGTCLEAKELSPARIKTVLQEFQAEPDYRNRAREAGERLMSLGGVARVAEVLEREFAGKNP